MTMDTNRRSLVIQGVLLVLIVINTGLMIWTLSHPVRCPEIMPPQVNRNGELSTCTKDPSSTPSRLVWNCA